MLGVGIALILQSIFSTESLWFFLLGIILSTVLAVSLYHLRGNQSILEFVPQIFKPDSKKKND